MPVLSRDGINGTCEPVHLDDICHSRANHESLRGRYVEGNVVDMAAGYS